MRLIVPLLLLAALSRPDAVRAGQQQYEPLAASVRTAMAVALKDRAAPEPAFATVSERVDWLSQMSERLPRKWQPELSQRIEFLKTVRYESGRAGLDPHLVLALIEVESYFRRYAVSSVGARGYMQVMPFWSRLIGDGDDSKLFDLRTNLRYGCLILRHYLDQEKGDLFRALGRYNGSVGRGEYPMAVLRSWKRWQYNAPATTTAAAPATTTVAVPATTTPNTAAPPAQLSAISPGSSDRGAQAPPRQ